MRFLRKFLAIILPILGGVLLLYSAVVEPTIHRQFLIIGIGFIVILVGAWRLFHRFLPNERRFLKLRGEMDAFVKLVRHLNTVSYRLQNNASPPPSQVIQALQNEMHAAVDRMVAVAGHNRAEPSVVSDTQQERDKAAAR
jgi:hypothetical protein